MAKKLTLNTENEPEIDYNAVTTVEDCESREKAQLDDNHRLEKQKRHLKDDKKKAVAAFNEQIKELDAKIDKGLGVVDAWRDRKKIILAGINAGISGV